MFEAPRLCRALLNLPLFIICAAALATPVDSFAKNSRSRRNDHSHRHQHFDPDQEVGCRAVVAGPVDLVRKRGRPRHEKISFASLDPSAPHFLRIENGGPDGDALPVTSARVYLNRRLILAPNRFNRSVDSIEVPIEVRDENLLLFRLAGKPGSELTFEVLAIDEQPPSIVEIFPPDESVVSEPQVTLTIVVEDALSEVTSVTCADVEATPGADEFACTAPLLPGVNEIDVIATDACGNQETATVTIIFDPPPVVSIDEPEDGDVIISGPVEVRGSVDDPDALVTVNDVVATGAAHFTATVPVRKGENTLVAVARDAAGGEGRDSVTISVLANPLGPTVSIASPEPDFLLGGPDPITSVPVRGKMFSAGELPEVTVNGSPAAVQRSSSQSPACAALGICSWDFAATLWLSKAGNPQLVEAAGTDSAGRTDSDSVMGNIDQCVIGGSDGYAIVGGADGQANRCHRIDGCSTPDIVAPDVQDPTMGTLGRRSTAFGKDTSLVEFSPHGAAPKDDLPCNHHDVCYQTCGSDKISCDDKMYSDMRAVCRAAYPESKCPYLPNLAKCSAWSAERDDCYRWAIKYRAGLSTSPAVVKFLQRQSEFCRP